MKQRMWSIQSKLSTSRRLLLLVGLTVCSLILSGGLVWIDNAAAVIPDSDPTTYKDFGHLKVMPADEADVQMNNSELSDERPPIRSGRPFYVP